MGRVDLWIIKRISNKKKKREHQKSLLKRLIMIEKSIKRDKNRANRREKKDKMKLKI